MINVTWKLQERREFWHITSMLNQETLTQWINSVVEPIERAKIEQKATGASGGKLSRITNWLSRSKVPETQ